MICINVNVSRKGKMNIPPQNARHPLPHSPSKCAINKCLCMANSIGQRRHVILFAAQHDFMDFWRKISNVAKWSNCKMSAEHIFVYNGHLHVDSVDTRHHKCGLIKHLRFPHFNFIPIPHSKKPEKRGPKVSFFFFVVVARRLL